MEREEAAAKASRTGASGIPVVDLTQGGAGSEYVPPGDVIRSYEALGDPPKDPLLALEYVLEHIVIAVHDLALDRSIEAPQKRRGLAELGRTAGMLGPKAREKLRLKKAEEKLNRDEAGEHGVQPYKGRRRKAPDG